MQKIVKINCKANAAAIFTFGIYKRYTNLPHFDLISMLNNFIDLAFKRENKEYIDISGITAFWCHKSKHLHFFTKKGIDAAPFGVNFYLSKHESNFMSKLTHCSS